MGRVAAAVANETRNRWAWQERGAETNCGKVLGEMDGGTEEHRRTQTELTVTKTLNQMNKNKT